MNYRHIYHAGNICDVVKHVSFSLLIERMKLKETPFCVFDTHAGIGLYDLQDERARKTQEANAGILKFITSKILLEFAGYARVLQTINPDWHPGSAHNFRHYPGSPILAHHLLRHQDRLIACELHSEDIQTLRRTFEGDKKTQIHHRDGYEALKALLPPSEKRGIVLIDPPFEQPNEFQKLIEVLTQNHQRWPQGCIILWYPIKERPTLWRFYEALIGTGIPKQLCAEFVFNEEARSDCLNGSGLLILNPPWKFDEDLNSFYPKLHQALGTVKQHVSVKWLTKEKDF